MRGQYFELQGHDFILSLLLLRELLELLLHVVLEWSLLGFFVLRVKMPTDAL